MRRARQNDTTASQKARKSTARSSNAVTQRSNALDHQRSVLTWLDPSRIAASLKRSAQRSTRRKGTPFQSAMSMLTFYINRAGRELSASQRRVLERAKTELRGQFGRTTTTRR